MRASSGDKSSRHERREGKIRTVVSPLPCQSIATLPHQGTPPPSSMLQNSQIACYYRRTTMCASPCQSSPTCCWAHFLLLPFLICAFLPHSHTSELLLSSFSFLCLLSHQTNHSPSGVLHISSFYLADSPNVNAVYALALHPQLHPRYSICLPEI